MTLQRYDSSSRRTWIRGAVASMTVLLLCAPAAVAHEADDTDLDGVHDPLDNCTLAAIFFAGNTPWSRLPSAIPVRKVASLTVKL